ncbi:putative leucine-rich repeat-containing protein DDB_G0290503 isoform X2 [Battus philenor]|uniref:putative leucine-rich repeat-containing protein DDB_G0290503 isoform X2 n=1 Tax=Battus philenor TaxID=42288 RepID=UPI0035CFF0D5
MSNSRIPSPARSLGARSTPRRHKFRRSQSVGSPAHSITSAKLSYMIEQHQIRSTMLSPLKNRMSVLTNNTDIDEPGHQSWWKKLDENSRSAMEVVEGTEHEQIENVEEYIDAEILSQENRNNTIDLPESSDCESIQSIVIPQRKFFAEKDNCKTQKIFTKLVDNRDNISHRKSKSNYDKTITVGKKELFNTKEKRKAVIPPNLLDISMSRTLVDKTKDFENLGRVRNFFGNRVNIKRKNMFAEFIVSDSEDEIPDIEPKTTGFSKKTLQQEQQQHRRSTLKGAPNTSMMSEISNLEIDDWSHLPSSTMMENQFGSTDTPVKRIRLSIENDKNDCVNKTDQLDKSLTTKNALMSKFKNGEEFIVSQCSTLEDLNKSKKSQTAQNQSKMNLTEKSRSENISSSVRKSSSEQSYLNKTEDIQISQKEESEVTKTPERQSDIDSKNASTEVIENDNEDENDFTLQYDNDEDNMHENTAVAGNDILDQTDEDNTSSNKTNIANKNKTAIESNSQKQSTHTSFNKHSVNTSTDKVKNNTEEETIIHNKTIPQYQSEINNEINLSETSNKDKNINSSLKVIEVVQEFNAAINVQQNNLSVIKDKTNLENLRSEQVRADEIDNANQNNRVVLEISPNLDNPIENQVGHKSEIVNKNIKTNFNKSNVYQSNIVSKENQGGNEINVKDLSSENPEIGNDKEVCKERQSIKGVEKSYGLGKGNSSIDEEIYSDGEPEDKNTKVVVEDTNDKNDEPKETLEENEKNATEIDPKISEETEKIVDNQDDEKEDDNERDSNLDLEEMNELNSTKVNNEELLEDNVDDYKKCERNRNLDLGEHQQTSELNGTENEEESFVENGESNCNDNDEECLENSDDDREEDNEENSNSELGEPQEMSESNAIDNEEESILENEENNCEDNDEESFEDNDDGPGDTDENIENYSFVQNSHEFDEPDHVINNEQSSDTLDVDSTRELAQEVKRAKRQTTLEMFLLKMKTANMEKRHKTEEAIKNSLRAPVTDSLNLFKMPTRPKTSLNPKHKMFTQAKPRTKQTKQLENLPPDMLDDFKYKPPRRFQPSNASWVTKRLYKYLETKLEPKYDYKARVRAEKLVETIYNFTKDLRRHNTAPIDAVKVLKQEMARLNIVKTHFDFYQFFHDFMPRDIRVKVVPDIVNKISLPKHGVFSDIIS